MECNASNVLIILSSNGHRQFIPDYIVHQGVYNLRSKAKVKILIELLQQSEWVVKEPSKRLKGKILKNKKKNNSLADALKAKEEAENMRKMAEQRLKQAREASEKMLKEAQNRKEEIINEGMIEATPDELLCGICYEKPKNAVFLHGTTGHNFGCYECSIQCETCPICRAPFDQIYKIFDV